MDEAEALTVARQVTRTRRRMIQGFTYGKRQVIRDTARHPSNQEIWAVEHSEGGYEDAHAAMMYQIEIAQNRLVVEALLEMGFELKFHPITP